MLKASSAVCTAESRALQWYILIPRRLVALLVVISPRDSVASAWAGTLLTIALVVAAVVQKVYQDLTLHHATLVMK